ncbi:MAG TPA: ABC transporter substrate-binding protein [Pseudolabrys sp.]|nr:ABC transporter substrate-binding protein [Pseudolabrys sp.]
MSAHHSRRWALVTLLLAGALMTGAAAAEIPVKFTLDSKFEGPSAPFLLPVDKGYYKAEGLDVSIDTAPDSVESIHRVASGNYDMGVGDINLMIKLRDKNPGLPVKAVFMLYNRPPYAVIGRKSRGIKMPKDLEGKTLGAPATDSVFAQWPIFTQANSIDASKVTIENVSFPVREPMLAAGQIDAITGLSFSSYIDLKDKGVPVDDLTVLLMADYGVALYGNAIFVNSKFAAEHPEAVSGFLRAFVKGLKEAVRQPTVAIDSVLKRGGTAKKNVELDRLTMAIRENIVTPEVRTDGYGGIDEERFARAIEQIALTHKFKAAKPKPGDIFDPSFLPSAAIRKY